MGKTYTDAQTHVLEDAPDTEHSSRKAAMVDGVDGYDAQAAKLSPTPPKTLGGRWSTAAYETFIEPARRGAEMRLNFTPDAAVDATKIGLTQTCKATRGSGGGMDVYYPKGNRGVVRSGRSAKSDEGRNIDRQYGQNNPIFGEENDTLSETRNAQFGRGRIERDEKRYAYGHTRPGIKDASLYDKAGLGWRPGEDIRCTFETTAVVLAGKHEGAYLGSVSWGYTAKADGSMTQDPLNVVAQGVPSDAFMDAAEQWNAQSYDYEEFIRTGSNPATALDETDIAGHTPGEALPAGWKKVSLPIANMPLPVADKAQTSLSSYEGVDIQKRYDQLLAARALVVQRYAAMLKQTGGALAELRKLPDYARVKQAKNNLEFELKMLKAKGAKPRSK